MQININTDKTIERNQGLDEHVNSVVSAAVQRFGEHITRVEVHLSDENSKKTGGNRCMLEARVTGYQPIAVSDHSEHLHQAISGAADKLQRAINSALGRLHDKHLHDTPKLQDDAEQVSDEVSK
ncbi:HPF/RaiA family ribosome-associated protein [Massilia glaciei]|uniref:Ribosomal subunit interface protein n=1 Tax=Massilia glaciei TaxID=1524097 RepID=A0A2U2I531_9BURK|nr:HPF/RaiA family ribosome-associated protein [Massilia glaciei]PWF54759.1 ribosomal subunit interface protein [Massilia glaciei]